jgi:hypothetical protein
MTPAQPPLQPTQEIILSSTERKRLAQLAKETAQVLNDLLAIELPRESRSIIRRLRHLLPKLENLTDVIPALHEIIEAGPDGAGCGMHQNPASWSEYRKQLHELALQWLTPLWSNVTFANDSPENGVMLVDGGFEYGGKFHSLKGRPLQMLNAILHAPNNRMTREKLRNAMEVDDQAVTYPDQVISDTAGKLRSALRRAIADAGRDCKDPFPSTGRGADLTYSLSMP